jgi:DNA-binding NtrC family response regulator
MFVLFVPLIAATCAAKQISTYHESDEVTIDGASTRRLIPPRVQRSLLRFVEDNRLTPLGGRVDAGKQVDVRLVLGTNVPVEESCENGQLAADLVARFHRVSIPPLRERRADVPAIFLHVLRGALAPETFDAVSHELDAEAIERLCLRDFRRGNVRELQDLASIIAARIGMGEPPDTALREAFDESSDRSDETGTSGSTPAFEDPHRSLYERNREAIVAGYREVSGNISRLEALLQSRGILANRHWLAVYLERWGVRPIRRRG